MNAVWNYVFNSIHEIIIGLLVAGIAVILERAWRVGILADLWDRIWNRILVLIRMRRPHDPRTVGNDPVNLMKLRATLVSRVRQEQILWPWNGHYGQFGRESSKSFRTAGEDMDTKPRMYLTLWPGTVFAKRKICDRNVVRAIEGIQRLFRRHRDNRIHAKQEAGPNTSPTAAPKNNQRDLISYRHSICGALFLQDVQGWTPLVRDVLDAMIDHQGPHRWQNADGGWAQCDRELIESDLWGSAYAARLLNRAMIEGALQDSERSAASEALFKTITYFEDLWRKNEWSLQSEHHLEGSPSEVNAVFILIEIAPLLRAHRRELLDSVVTQIKQHWITSEGNLRADYLAVINSVRALPKGAVYARLSYALARARDTSDLTKRLFRKAAENLDENFLSADLAFLLDLTCAALNQTGCRPRSISR